MSLADKLLPIAKALYTLSEDYKYHSIKYAFPDKGPYRRERYPQAMEIMKKGKTKRFRAFIGANRSGKSFWLATELTYHATGEYPEWWEGKTIPNIKTIWIVAESGALFRDSLQRLLLGDPGEDIGTGLIPLAEKNNGVGIVNWGAMTGTSGGGAIGSILIKHKNGQHVSIIIKTNEMSREQFQAAAVDIVAFDEEPREDILTECTMRLMGTGKKEPGITMFAFMPIKGLTNVVRKFLPDGLFPESGSPKEDSERYVCNVGWKDSPHLSEQDKKTLWEEIPEHERDARVFGRPSLGTGLIYPVYEENIVVEPFDIPPYFPRAYALDFGWHRTAALWGAKDPSTGTLYLYSEYYREKTIISIHALNVMAKGKWIPGIADPSGGGRDSHNGKLAIESYRELDLELYEGDNDMAGMARCLDLLETGKLKVFSTLKNFLREIRTFRYDSSNPNKPAKNQEDHLMDCMKYLTSKFDYYAKSEHDWEETEFGPDTDDIQFKNDGRDDLAGY